jgi:hypothetical protein
MVAAALALITAHARPAGLVMTVQLLSALLDAQRTSVPCCCELYHGAPKFRTR